MDIRFFLEITETSFVDAFDMRYSKHFVIPEMDVLQSQSLLSDSEVLQEFTFICLLYRGDTLVRNHIHTTMHYNCRTA